MLSTFQNTPEQSEADCVLPKQIRAPRSRASPNSISISEEAHRRHLEINEGLLGLTGFNPPPKRLANAREMEFWADYFRGALWLNALER